MSASLLDLSNLPAYVINLDRAKDKFERFKQYQKVIPLLKRLPASDAKDMYPTTESIMQDDRISFRTRMQIISNERRSPLEVDNIGAVGCTFSHIRAWDECERDNSEYALILEDDVMLGDPALFEARLQSVFKQIAQKDWDVWLLGWNIGIESTAWSDCERSPKLARSFTYPFLGNFGRRRTTKAQRTLQFWGTHAYIVRVSALDKIRKRVMPIELHIDAYMGMLAQANELNIINHTDLCIKQKTVNGIGSIQHSNYGVVLMHKHSCLVSLILLVLSIIVAIIIWILRRRACASSD
jgi:GR25 family glycosyltransferase involved in LPS biosynthesis